ncbi:primosomal protein [Marine Group I thaumarchaeote]|uniref:Primosomal protein n=1 Tax=Marine Group I thaumarchaeote TaxID=2511932 RepID=A0A7K4MRS5_9ARCH|nr:primosomal protein [Marine Group I thaumarchaeote]
MKLITEHMSDIEYIVEGKGKKQYIKGVFLQSDVKNQNGRVYPFSVLHREVKNYNKKYVEKSRALGELGHPMGPTINLDRVSHLITELYEDGKNFIGKAKIMDTPNGKIVKNLLESGVRLGVSSRGLGTVKTNKQGVNEVQKDFVLSTIDVVADPSAPDAFVNGIMEGKEFSVTGEIEHFIRKDVHNTNSKKLDEKKLELFKKFLGNL